MVLRIKQMSFHTHFSCEQSINSVKFNMRGTPVSLLPSTRDCHSQNSSYKPEFSLLYPLTTRSKPMNTSSISCEHPTQSYFLNCFKWHPKWGQSLSVCLFIYIRLVNFLTFIHPSILKYFLKAYKCTEKCLVQDKEFTVLFMYDTGHYSKLFS
jgi:hypothetical protein